jgi:drug/metabolite transporter (DMT)-like permease
LRKPQGAARLAPIRRDNIERMPFVLLGFIGLVWGVSYPVTAIALDGFSVLTLRCLTQFLGAGALVLWAAARGRHLAVEREAWPDLIVAALLNMTIMPICFALGIYLLGPGRTSVLVYTMPIWAGLFARLILGEKLTVSRIAALILGAGAVAALLSQDLSELRNAPLGAAITLLAAMSFGLGTVWLKRRTWRANAAVVVFWQLAIGSVPIVAISAFAGFPPDLAQAGAKEWLAVLFLGVAANGAAYFAWFRVVELLPAGVSGISTLIVPAVAVAASGWIAGETLHPHDMAAMSMIGAALVLVLFEQLRIGWRSAVPGADRRRRGL